MSTAGNKSGILSVSDPSEEIVVSGISGRFPKSKNMTEFAYNLYNKVDMVDDSETRWRHTFPDLPKRFGRIDCVEKFDATFFSVHHRQANNMDPQCRMLLEHAYEAILDAGVNPKKLRGTNTGVFIGCTTADADEMLLYGNGNKEYLGVAG